MKPGRLMMPMRCDRCGGGFSARTSDRAWPQSHGSIVGCLSTCRDAGSHSGGSHPWGKIPFRLHALCHSGALSDVCRSDRVVTVVEDSIRCVRPQARLPFVSTFTHPFSSACHCHARSPGGRMCGTNAIFFQVETLIAYIKQPL